MHRPNRNVDPWATQPPNSMESPWEAGPRPAAEPGQASFMEDMLKLQQIGRFDPETSRIIGRLSSMYQHYRHPGPTLERHLRDAWTRQLASPREEDEFPDYGDEDGTKKEEL